MTTLQRIEVQEDVLEAAQQLITSRRAKNTRDAYQNDWDQWTTFCGARAVNLKSPGLSVATEFRDGLMKERKPASVVRLLSSLHFFYKAFIAVGLVKINPFAHAWLPRPQVSILSRTPIVEGNDAEKILSVVAQDKTERGLRDHAILRLLHDTGMRRGSVQSLKRDGISQVGNLTRVRIEIKGGTERTTVLIPEAEQALFAWLEVAPESEFVFPNYRDANRPMNLTSINKIVSLRAVEAGIKHVHPHCFRATLITNAYDAKIYERDIQAAVHHADSSTTRRYDRGLRGEEVAGLVSKFRSKK